MKLDNVRIDAITTFIEIVEAGTLGAAGRRLGISKSLVSKRLATLEAALNVRLLNRSTRQLTLTESGQYFFERCRVLLAQFQSVSEELSDQSEDIAGRINVSLPFCLANSKLTAALNVFTLQHPSLVVQIDYTDALPDLIGESFDLALAIGKIPNSSLIMRRLGKSDNVLVYSDAYARRYGVPANIEEIEYHLFAGATHLQGQAEWQFRRGTELRVISPKVRMRTNTRQGLLEAARDGLAIAALPTFLAHEAVTAGAVQVIASDWELVSDDVCILFPEKRYISRKVRALSGFLAEQIATIPNWDRPDWAPIIVPAG